MLLVERQNPAAATPKLCAEQLQWPSQSSVWQAVKVVEHVLSTIVELHSARRAVVPFSEGDFTPGR